jgi:hypothetical protein
MALLEVQNEWKAFSLHESPFGGGEGEERGKLYSEECGNP